jgi:hypothetical protein
MKTKSPKNSQKNEPKENHRQDDNNIERTIKPKKKVCKLPRATFYEQDPTMML